MSFAIKVLMLGVHKNNDHEDYQDINPISSSVTLIKTKDKNILVDTGFCHLQKELLEALKKESLTPSDIDIVINTHYHFDHCGNNFLFSKSKVFVGPAMWDFGEGSIKYYSNEEKCHIEGVEVFYTPGHDMWHWSVFVEENGISWGIAGDAVGYNSIMTNVLPAFYSRKKYLRSAKLVLERADKIVPGHGKIIEGKKREELLEQVNSLINESV